MKVILKQEIKGLGKIGDVKTVKDGYARNFLFPKGLVLEANDRNLKLIEKEKIKYEETQKRVIGEATEYAKKLSAVSVTIAVQSHEENKIFGSVGSADIAEALKAEGFDIDKKSIELPVPLKEIGAFDVPVRIHQNVEAKIKVWVVAKKESDKA